MCLDAQSLISATVIVVNVALTLFFTYTLHRSTSVRSRPLWSLVAIYGVGSTIGVAVLFLSMRTLSVLNLSAEIFYLLVGSFVFTIEVPGYLRLTKHDHALLTYLEDWRSELVKLGYDFVQYGSLKSKSADGVTKLQEVGINQLVNDFIEHCGRMGNLDQGFWTLLLGEINRSIDEVQGRSKHPAPKLIDLLSLSGLSFLIAQILRVLG